MKIALLGSAPSSVGLAPFKNKSYHEWVEAKKESMAVVHGQIPGDFELWGCSPGCWAVIPRATRWFEVHRWQPGQQWFSPEYCQFLRDFDGQVYTGAPIPEIPSHVVYPLDRIEERFSSYFLTSSLALMMALAIDEIESIRHARKKHNEWYHDHCGPKADWAEGVRDVGPPRFPAGYSQDECDKILDETDADDVIGMWGVDMAATEEYSFQRPGCQFFVLEALRRGIGVYLPPESDLMRPMPVYGISEWDHNYIKMTSRARELNEKAKHYQGQEEEAQRQKLLLQGELASLTSFVQTWTNPFGMRHGLVIRQTPGTGLGGGVTHVDERPVKVEGFAKVEKAMGMEVVHPPWQEEEQPEADPPQLKPDEHE